jgi:hypothetical protein
MATRIKTPVHLWIVGALALLWNGMGVTDYVMTRLRNEEYLRLVMPAADPAVVYGYFDQMPLLAGLGWALGVWGALAGTLLLLVRSHHAVTAYLMSLIGAVVSFGFQFAGPKPPEGMDSAVMPIIVTAIAVGLLLYARAMQAKRVLR